jgi:hypothetical protein
MLLLVIKSLEFPCEDKYKAVPSSVLPGLLEAFKSSAVPKADALPLPIKVEFVSLYGRIVI